MSIVSSPSALTTRSAYTPPAHGIPTDTTYETQLGDALKDKYAVVYVGYSGAGYAQAGAVKQAIARDLKAICDTRHTTHDMVVVAGGTPEGIGMVYDVARDMRLTTFGIVAAQGAQYASTNCEMLMTVTNASTDDWSTRMPESDEELVVAALRVATEQGNGAQLLAYNGGPQAFEEAMAATRAGYDVTIMHDHQPASTGRPMPFNDPGRLRALIDAGAQVFLTDVN